MHVPERWEAKGMLYKKPRAFRGQVWRVGAAVAVLIAVGGLAAVRAVDTVQAADEGGSMRDRPPALKGQPRTSLDLLCGSLRSTMRQRLWRCAGR
jgi:hypothetical protein